jgi:hypothetical protein
MEADISSMTHTLYADDIASSSSSSHQQQHHHQNATTSSTATSYVTRLSNGRKHPSSTVKAPSSYSKIQPRSFGLEESQLGTPSPSIDTSLFNNSLSTVNMSMIGSSSSSSSSVRAVNSSYNIGKRQRLGSQEDMSLLEESSQILSSPPKSTKVSYHILLYYSIRLLIY